MAFPTVQTADTQNGTVTSNSTSWTLTYPTNLVSGELILALIASDGTNTTKAGFPANWTRFMSWHSSTAVTLSGGVKISDGTETGNFSVTMPNEQGGWRVFRITGWYGSGLLGTDALTNSAGDADGMAGRITAAASSNPNSPSVDPANWGTEDTLWLSVMAADTSRTVSAFPNNCPDLQTSDVSGGANGATLGVAMASSAVSSFSPTAYTISTSDEWAAATIAIRPGVVVYVPRHGFVNHQNPGVV